MARPRTFWFRHPASLAILGCLDLHRVLQRILNRGFVRAMTLVLGLAMLGTIVLSLYALRQVAHSADSIGDRAMTGVECAVAMKATVRTAQLDLLRSQLPNGRKFERSDVTGFETKMNELLADFRASATDTESDYHARRLAEHLVSYRQALRRLSAGTTVAPAAFAAADQISWELVYAVDAAYRFNELRIRGATKSAKETAQRAMRLSTYLGLAFMSLASFVALVSFLSYCFSVPEENA